MRLDLLSIGLRQRNPWEAMDLGLALTRRHAGAVWRAWFVLTLPFFVLLNLVCWQLDKLWLAPLLLWWLKPLFARAPLYVLSRGVFGSEPGVRQTLRAAELWAWRPLLGWLTWRRLHPSRSLLMPVDMLEGVRGHKRASRVRVLQSAVSSQAAGLTFVCIGFELVLYSSVWVLALMFVPVEFLSESARAVWSTFFEHPPMWAQLLGNLMTWATMSVIEPLYVGAGFGLYLNRRTQLEAWDLELVFRRLADRVRAASSAATLAGIALALLMLSAVVPQARATAVAKPTPITPEAFVGPAWRPQDNRFSRSVGQAYRDPSLAPRREVTTWTLKTPLKENEAKPASVGWLKAVAAVIAFLGEFGAWIVAGALVLFVLLRFRHWLPWVRRMVATEPAPSEIIGHAPELAAALPEDIVQAARALWEGSHPREALALVYRASVAGVASRLGAPFPPGATEADCLRRAARLGDDALQAQFARIVRTWQAAAYAQRFPETAQFDALLRDWAEQFGEAA